MDQFRQFESPTHSGFLIFCMKLEVHRGRKWRIPLFEKKIWFIQKLWELQFVLVIPWLWGKFGINFPRKFKKSKISRAQRGKFNFVNWRGKFDPKFPEKAWDSWLIPLPSDTELYVSKPRIGLKLWLKWCQIVQSETPQLRSGKFHATL